MFESWILLFHLQWITIRGQATGINKLQKNNNISLSQNFNWYSREIVIENSAFSKSDIRALPVSNLSAAPVMHGCIPASGGL